VAVGNSTAPKIVSELQIYDDLDRTIMLAFALSRASEAIYPQFRTKLVVFQYEDGIWHGLQCGTERRSKTRVAPAAEGWIYRKSRKWCYIPHIRGGTSELAREKVEPQTTQRIGSKIEQEMTCP
jgi:hypothetical protein